MRDAVLQLFEKSPGVFRMVMPRWSLEEIKLGLRHVYPATKYPGMTTARVENLYSYYNGVPRYVLGKPSEVSGPAADRQDLMAFNDAVNTCDAVQVRAGTTPDAVQVRAGTTPEVVNIVAYNIWCICYWCWHAMCCCGPKGYLPTLHTSTPHVVIKTTRNTC